MDLAVCRGSRSWQSKFPPPSLRSSALPLARASALHASGVPRDAGPLPQLGLPGGREPGSRGAAREHLPAPAAAGLAPRRAAVRRALLERSHEQIEEVADSAESA